MIFMIITIIIVTSTISIIAIIIAIMNIVNIKGPWFAKDPGPALTVPLARQRRPLPESWGRRQSTVEYFGEAPYLGTPLGPIRAL